MMRQYPIIIPEKDNLAKGSFSFGKVVFLQYALLAFCIEPPSRQRPWLSLISLQGRLYAFSRGEGGFKIDHAWAILKTDVECGQ